jgi:hypothetical protein
MIEEVVETSHHYDVMRGTARVVPQEFADIEDGITFEELKVHVDGLQLILDIDKLLTGGMKHIIVICESDVWTDEPFEWKPLYANGMNWVTEEVPGSSWFDVTPN